MAVAMTQHEKMWKLEKGPNTSANPTQLAPSMVNNQDKGVEEQSSAQFITSSMTMAGGSDDSDSISDEMGTSWSHRMLQV